MTGEFASLHNSKSEFEQKVVVFILPYQQMTREPTFLHNSKTSPSTSLTLTANSAVSLNVGLRLLVLMEVVNFLWPAIG